MKRILFSLTIVLLLASCTQPEVPTITHENEYAQCFADMWDILDAYHSYLEELGINRNDIYKRYLSAAAEVATPTQFTKLMNAFVQEIGDPNIIIDYNHQFIQCPTKVKDYPAFNLVSGDLYTGNLWSEDGAYTYPFYTKSVSRTHANDSRSNYQLLLFGDYTWKSPTQAQKDSLYTYLSSLSDRATDGLILDLRGSYYIDFTSIRDILPYFYEKGTHTICEYQTSPTAETETCTIEGNGILANLPISIIVNERTMGEWALFARILQDRDNVAIISRSNGGAGCMHGRFGFPLGVELCCPMYRTFVSQTACYSPFKPEVFVEWEGTESEHGNLGYTDNIDYCIAAALDFIDSL